MIRVTRLLTASVLVFACAAGDLRAAEPEMTFTFRNVTTSGQASFRNDMQQARQKVREWWGTTFEDPIRVETDDSRQISMALVPAWRGEQGRMLFGAKTVDKGIAATIHETVHVYAPNANRFLAEGLATYGHELLGGKPAYPNMGRNIDELAALHTSKPIVLTLERVPTPTPLEQTHPHAYVMAASFVKFIIETHGMEKFRALYAMTPLVKMQRAPGDPARWAQVYGQDFSTLVDIWLAALPRK